MTTTDHAAVRRGTGKAGGKVDAATDAFALLLAEATRRGFYGAVTLSLTVQDGAIQQVRVATDRLVR